MFNDSNKYTEQFWNEKAKPCSHYERLSKYAEKFLEMSGISEGESVFDMGCGSGTLCLPLADLGHQVFCADFSGKMLQSVQDVIDEEKITLLTLKKLSWTDDWEKEELPVCDLAFSSRSMFVTDPFTAIKKLSSVAARKCCITVNIEEKIFDKSSSGYDFGNQQELDSFCQKCIAAVKKLGYEPECEIMNYDGSPSGWMFISWEV